MDGSVLVIQNFQDIGHMSGGHASLVNWFSTRTVSQAKVPKGATLSFSAGLKSRASTYWWESLMS